MTEPIQPQDVSPSATAADPAEPHGLTVDQRLALVDRLQPELAGVGVQKKQAAFLEVGDRLRGIGPAAEVERVRELALEMFGAGVGA